MGKTRAECSQNAYTSHASAFLSHWIQILANSSPKSDIKNPTLFFRILRSVGRGQHNNFFFWPNKLPLVFLLCFELPNSGACWILVSYDNYFFFFSFLQGPFLITFQSGRRSTRTTGDISTSLNQFYPALCSFIQLCLLLSSYIWF